MNFHIFSIEIWPCHSRGTEQCFLSIFPALSLLGVQVVYSKKISMLSPLSILGSIPSELVCLKFFYHLWPQTLEYY